MILGVMMVLMVCSESQESTYAGRGRQGAPPSRASDWSVAGRAGARLRYNDNIFSLDGDQERRLEQDRASDRTSGRFDDMESVEDFIFSPGVRLDLEGDSPLGRGLEIRFEAKYDQYLLNTRKSHVDLDLMAEQRVSSDGWLRLSFEFRPEYFTKNYLADAVDPGSDGVSSSERRYEAGSYGQWGVHLRYRHRIVRDSRNQPLGLDGTFSGGYQDRAYDSPFESRNRESLILDLGLRFGYRLRPVRVVDSIQWGVRYRFEDAQSDVASEVLLLDEPDFGIDLNGDADATDNNARTVQAIDRSFRSHRIGLFVEVELSAGVELGTGYAHRFRDYSSGEPFNVSHRGREDERDEIEVYTSVDLGMNWDGRIGYRWQRQETDRPSDPDGTGEELDYRRNVFTVALQYSW